MDMANLVSDDTLRESAVESVASRKEVLRQSVRLTLLNPFFGVGPGMFAVANADDAKERGKRTHWLETHNAYTQVSSECGLPALGFYLTALLSCIFGTTSVYRKFRNGQEPRQKEIAAMAFALRASLVAFSVTALFSSVAYQSLFPGLAGLTVAFMASVREDLELLRTGQAAPVPMQAARPSRLPQRPLPWPGRPTAPVGARSQVR